MAPLSTDLPEPVPQSGSRRLWLSLLLFALLLVAVAGVLASASQRRLLGLFHLVERSDRVLLQLSELLGALVDAETAQRGFVITGDSAFLEPFTTARERVPRLLQSLDTLLSADPRAQALHDSLTLVAGRRLRLIDSTVARREAIDTEILTDRARFQRGKMLTDQARTLIFALESSELQRYSARRAEIAVATRRTELLMWAALGGSVALVALLFLGMRNEVSRRRASEAALARMNLELDARVGQRTAALTQLVEEQRRVNELLEGLFTQSTFAIVGLDADYRVVLWNPAAERMFGVSAGEVLGRQGPLLKSPADQARELEPQELFRRAAQGERLHDLEVRRLRQDGTPIDLRVSTVTLYTADGKPRGIVEIMEDVTERKQVDQQLTQAQKMEAVGQLTGGVAHDFNNLLAAIVGNLDMLGERLSNDPANAKLVRLALEAALRGANLTRQLLAFSRRQPLQPRPVRLNGLIQALDDLLHRTLGGAIEVQTRLQPDLWVAGVDPTQVETAILNLAVNARDAMPRGGRLTIETANRVLEQDYTSQNPEVRPGEYVMLSVSDTGTGMPAEVLARVFDPFFSTKEPGKGSGLGLSMVYGFARQSGGHVKIYSEVGHGTTVRLYLPRSAERGAVIPDLREPDQKIPPGRGEIILIVEDTPAVRDTAANLIQGLGYQVLTADRAQSAMEVLESRENVDLLFTDVVMPGGVSGIELARMAKARRPGIKVLFTTGFSDDVLPSGAGGTEPTLVKPYQRHQLARLLRSLLD